MRAYPKWIMILSTIICFSSPISAAPLTPPNEPKENSFYVCFKERRINTVDYSPILDYQTYQYKGCIISRKPCCDHQFKQTPCPPVKTCCGQVVQPKTCPPASLNLFGWFDTYPQALNAFYRCAYS